ncbi:MAG: murein L,D-transpeptidase catalytic domain family protein [Bacteroidia bacterium]|jgi:hypothetical protein|nr:murein L,D-transpeptidase catalytic domain family protein [Bacteroidia bacterium]
METKALFFLLIFSGALFQCNEVQSVYKNNINSLSTSAYQPDKVRIKEAFNFCKRNRFDTLFCILIDMKIHSGKSRFFVWDFKNEILLKKFLVSHGCCNNPWSEDKSKESPVFSNIDGSHCSSLGKYKIGARGPSDWGIGIKYLLHGLEKSNSNAAARFIVLHSWDLIPDEEVYPAGVAEGWGCPSISNSALMWLDSVLVKKSKPVLLWMYN